MAIHPQSRHPKATSPGDHFARGEMSRAFEPGLPGDQSNADRRLQRSVEVEIVITGEPKVFHRSGKNAQRPAVTWEFLRLASITDRAEFDIAPCSHSTPIHHTISHLALDIAGAVRARTDGHDPYRLGQIAAQMLIQDPRVLEHFQIGPTRIRAVADPDEQRQRCREDRHHNGGRHDQFHEGSPRRCSSSLPCITPFERIAGQHTRVSSAA